MNKYFKLVNVYEEKLSFTCNPCSVLIIIQISNFYDFKYPKCYILFHRYLQQSYYDVVGTEIGFLFNVKINI